MDNTELSNEALARYSRHLLLPELDLEGQAKLTNSSVVIIGAGGLGSPCALYLASSGIGNITIADDDKVELSNLQRQIAFTTQDINTPKATSLQQHLSESNPLINITGVTAKATKENLPSLIEDADIVIDASDNFETRYAINDICHTLNKTLVSGAAIRFQGQVSIFPNKTSASPCYQCLYPKPDNAQPQDTCRDRGVFAPLVGIIGSIQAAETIKIIVGVNAGLADKLLTFDAKTMLSRVINIKKDPDCPVCSH